MERNEFNISTVLKYVRAKINDATPGTAAHRALCDVYSYIKTNMNMTYGVLSAPPSKPITPNMTNEELVTKLKDVLKGDDAINE